MADLSAPEQALLQLATYDRDRLKTWAWNYIRANPSCDQATFEAALHAEAESLGVWDAVTSLLGYYIVNAGGWEAFRGLLLTYDLHTVMMLAPELDRPLPTLSESYRMRLEGNPFWGFEPAADLDRPLPTRDPDLGNFVVEETMSGTLDGVYVTIRQRHHVELIPFGNSTKWETTPLGWEIV